MFILGPGGNKRGPMPSLTGFSLTEVVLIVLSVSVFFAGTWLAFYLAIRLEWGLL